MRTYMAIGWGKGNISIMWGAIKSIQLNSLFIGIPPFLLLFVHSSRKKIDSNNNNNNNNINTTININININNNSPSDEVFSTNTLLFHILNYNNHSRKDLLNCGSVCVRWRIITQDIPLREDLYLNWFTQWHLSFR